jgi:hypothetical protein
MAYKLRFSPEISSTPWISGSSPDGAGRARAAILRLSRALANQLITISDVKRSIYVRFSVILGGSGAKFEEGFMLVNLFA